MLLHRSSRACRGEGSKTSHPLNQRAGLGICAILGSQQPGAKGREASGLNQHPSQGLAFDRV